MGNLMKIPSGNKDAIFELLVFDSPSSATLRKNYDYVVCTSAGTIHRERLAVSMSNSRESIMSKYKEGVSYNLSYAGKLEIYKDCKVGDVVRCFANPGCGIAVGINLSGGVINRLLSFFNPTRKWGVCCG